MRFSNDDRLLTREDVADLLTVSVGTLEVWASTKRYALPYHKVGRNVRYWESDVMAFVNARKVQPSPIVGG